MAELFTEERDYSLEDLQKITEILRSSRGCPWDREQTHASLRGCMMEEAGEVLEGIDLYEKTGDWDNLCEELGDVLWQVVMHSVIAQEEGLFTLKDVIRGISEKMIRRHPHVFGAADGLPPEDLSWEEIKRRERAGRNSLTKP